MLVELVTVRILMTRSIFFGNRKEAERGVKLLVTFGTITRLCGFIIVEAQRSYNTIFRRPLLKTFQTITSSFHQCLEYNIGDFQIWVQPDPKLFRECYVIIVNMVSWKEESEVWWDYGRSCPPGGDRRSWGNGGTEKLGRDEECQDQLGAVRGRKEADSTMTQSSTWFSRRRGSSPFERKSRSCCKLNYKI